MSWGVGVIEPLSTYLLISLFPYFLISLFPYFPQNSQEIRRSNSSKAYCFEQD